MHEVKKYPCKQCDYQATEMGSLNKHQVNITQQLQATHVGKEVPVQGI